MEPTLPHLPTLVDQARRALGDDRPLPPPLARPSLQALLTRLPPGQIPEDLWPVLDCIWGREAALKPVVDALRIPVLATEGWLSRVALWHGDITTLSADAIVNAANAGLTGCYVPFHACVDNAIHAAAGPRLREACGRVMARRGRPEPTATATVTPGAFLPARHVIHTVGPIVEGLPSLTEERDLVRCYRACLQAASSLPVPGPSVAFCGVSTGLYGFPVERAAPLVLHTVRTWLEHDPTLSRVLLVTYTDRDHQAYTTALQEVSHA